MLPPSPPPGKTDAYRQWLHDHVFAPSEARFAAVLLDWYEALRAHQIRRIELARPEETAAEIAFELAPWRASAWGVTQPIYGTILAYSEAQAASEIERMRRKSWLARAEAPLVPLRFQRVIERSVASSRARILRRLQEKLDAGASRQEQRQSIEELFASWRGGRVRRIALDQADSAVNSGRRRAQRAVPMFDWLTAGDERVRESHEAYGRAGSKPRDFNWPRVIGRSHILRFPHDPKCRALWDKIG